MLKPVQLSEEVLGSLPKNSLVPEATRLQALQGLERIIDRLGSGDGYLRPGQEAVMYDLRNFFAKYDKGYVSMPTGAGKTVLFGTLLASHNIKSLVVVPTRNLIAQTIDELRALGIDNAIQAIDVRSPRDAETYQASQVVVTTYAQFTKSANVPWGKYKINPDDYGMVILDEAHHALAEGASGALRQFNHALQVGFTATPDYAADRELKTKLPRLIHELSIQEAVELGLITGYANTLLVTGADMSGVPVVRNDYERASLDKAINTAARNSQIATFVAEHFGDKKIIVSCNSVDHAVAMSSAFKQAGLEAGAVYGAMTKGRLTKELEKFQAGETQVLCNNKVLTEGFNDPTVEVIINASPTMSRVRQQQRTGRGLRINMGNPDKELVIVDCIDEDYQKRPALFFDGAIAGSTGLAAISPALHERLQAIAEQAPKALRYLANDDAIAEHMKGLLQPRKPKQSESIESITEDERGKVHLILGFTLINGILQRETPRLYGMPGEDESFHDDGLCAQTDPEAFFPEKGGSTREAKQVCHGCLVKEDCLEYALANNERFGVWGGLSERERRKLGKHVLGFA